MENENGEIFIVSFLYWRTIKLFRNRMELPNSVMQIYNWGQYYVYILF